MVVKDIGKSAKIIVFNFSLQVLYKHLIAVLAYSLSYIICVIIILESSSALLLLLSLFLLKYYYYYYYQKYYYYNTKSYDVFLGYINIYIKYKL